MHLIACGMGAFFNPGGAIVSLVILLLVKPLAYYAYIKAFRYRVSREIPMTNSRAAKLAVLRAAIGFVFIGGGAWVLLSASGSTAKNLSWVFLYGARIAAWWIVGQWGAGIRGWRLFGWIVGGMILNVAFDGAIVLGLATGVLYPLCVVGGMVLFIAVLDARGRRDRLKFRFSDDPRCHVCTYNLTGNLSGICPECGTPVRPRVVEASAAL